MEVTNKDGAVSGDADCSYWKVVLNHDDSLSDSDEVSTPRENVTSAVLENSQYFRESRTEKRVALKGSIGADDAESATGRDTKRLCAGELDNEDGRSSPKDIRREKSDVDDKDNDSVMDADVKSPQEEKVKCNQCSVFIHESALSAHISTVHTGRKTNFICEDCGKGFKFESGYCLHRSKNHGVALPKSDQMSQHKVPMKPKISDLCFPCEICGKEFRHISSFTLHLHRHQPEKILVCDICEKTFFTEAAFKGHQQLHQKLQPSQCYVCMKMCGTPALYTNHIRQHQSEAKYQCDKCPKVFMEAGYLVAHLLGHMQKALYRCSVCDKTFPSKSDRNIHKKQHKIDCEAVTKKNTSKKQQRTDDLPRTENSSNEKKQKGDSGPGTDSISNKERQRGHDSPGPEKTGHENSRRNNRGSGTVPTNSRIKRHVYKVHQNKKVYQCRTCGVKCPKWQLLLAHQKDHAVKKKFFCKVCEKQFDLRSEFLKHMDSHADDVIYKCVVCYKQFMCMDSLEKHVGGHTSESLDCCVCGQQLADISDIMEHVKKHKYCPITMAEAEKSRRDNRNKNSGSKQIKRVQVKCNICAKTFHFVSSLQSHLRIHQEDEMLNCHICGEPHQGVKALREHINNHKKETTDERADSTGQRNTSGDGKREKTASGGVRRRANRCDICLEKFVNYYNCKSHRLLHTGEKPFRCDVCGQKYLLAGALKLHMLSHTTDRPHVCEICGKSFKQPYILREHQMSHTGHKPFLCDICGKSFVNKKKLRLHTFVHTRETPFNCKVCGRGFRAFVTRQKHKCEGPPDSSRKEATSDTGPVIAGSIQTDEARQHETSQLPQTIPSFQPAYENFAYHNAVESDYSPSNQTLKQDQGRNLLSQDHCQPLQRILSSTVELPGDYSAHMTSYAGPRDPHSSVRPPPSVNWQLAPSNQGLPDEIVHSHDNLRCITTVERMDMSLGKMT